MTEEEQAVDQQEQAVEEQAEEGQTEEQSPEEVFAAKLKEAVEVSAEEIGPLRVKLDISIPHRLLHERMDEQFAELKRDADVPGFRKGRAPLELVRKRFADDVGTQLSVQLLSSGYLAAIEKKDLKPLGDPLVWTQVTEERRSEAGGSRAVTVEKLLPIDEACELIKLPKEGPLTFSCEIELTPQFELPSIKGIALKRPELTVTDEHVDAEIKQLLTMRGTYQPVEEGVVEPDDILFADMKMGVEDDVLKEQAGVDLAARDLRIEGVPLEGLGKALVGRSRGDEVAIEATVPDGHDNIDIRGKTAKFTFVIQDIKRLVVPPIDDALLSGIGMESEEELRSAIRARLEDDLAVAVKHDLRVQVRVYLIDNVEMDVPSGLSDRHADRVIARRKMEMYRANVPETDVAKAVDAMQAKIHDDAVRDLKLYFTLDKVAEELEVTVPEEEINGAIASIAARQGRRFDRVRDDLSKNDGLVALYMQLRDEKIMDRLIADGDVTELPDPVEERP